MDHRKWGVSENKSQSALLLLTAKGRQQLADKTKRVARLTRGDGIDSPTGTKQRGGLGQSEQTKRRRFRERSNRISNSRLTIYRVKV